MKNKVVIIFICCIMLLLSACSVGDSFKQGFQDGMNSATEETDSNK